MWCLMRPSSPSSPSRYPHWGRLLQAPLRHHHHDTRLMMMTLLHDSSLALHRRLIDLHRSNHRRLLQSHHQRLLCHSCHRQHLRRARPRLLPRHQPLHHPRLGSSQHCSRPLLQQWLGMSRCRQQPQHPIPALAPRCTWATELSHHMVTRAKAGQFFPNKKYTMQSEYDALLTKKTWTLVPRPPRANVVTRKWVFKHKC
jgi:hypothetical protein